MVDVEMADDSSPQYILSTVVQAHKSDVKCIKATSAGVLVSGSRDESVVIWTKKCGEYTATTKFTQSKGLQVNSLAYYETDDGWYIFVGRKDGSIAVYITGSDSPKKILPFHTLNVSVLHVDKKEGKLLSGSWDHNVVIWPIAEIFESEIAALQLTGHKNSVWALASIDNSPGMYLSASADKTIKLWKGDVEVLTYLGHTDVVRALAVLSSDRFISGANDATVRMWHIESGVCVGKFTSLKDDFIFSLMTVGPNVISCGDGGHIEVWGRTDIDGQLGLEHKQLIETPPLTAWCTAELIDDDFAVGGSDGRIYVFTKDSCRRANPEVMASMDAEVSAKLTQQLERLEAQSNQEIVIKVALDDGAPQLELRYLKGSDPSLAAQKFIQDNDLPITYLDEITSYIVANIPEARTAQNKKYARQATQKVTVDGEEYDYAMEVSTEDGRKMKLPFNVDDDPDYASQRFCEKHNLSMKLMARFAALLRSETAGLRAAGTSTNASSGLAADFFDPFTGSGRYVPSSGSSDFGVGGGADPLTGGGRYVPASTGGASASNFSGDPLTSEGRYIPGSANQVIPNSCRATDPIRPIGDMMPLTSYFLFSESISPKASAKLHELNAKQTLGHKLDDRQLATLEALMAGSTTSIDEDAAANAASALDIGLSWPMEDLVVILDLLRLALLQEPLNKYYCDMKGRGSDTIQRLCALLVSEPPVGVVVMISRAIANSFAHEYGRVMIQTEMSQLSGLMAKEAVANTKPIAQIASASALCNWSYLLLKKSEQVAELGPREDILRAIIKVLEPINSFSHISEVANTRLLQCIISLMWGDKQVVELCKSRNFSRVLQRMMDALCEENGKHLARTANIMINP